MGITRHILVILLILGFAAMANAQDKPTVHRINGKKYYLHMVEPGNTLYGISRQYSVAIEEIQAENEAALAEGLKVNQTLLIPVTKENKKELPPVEQEGNFLTHTVEAGQTLYSLSKEYNTELDVLLKANPEVNESGLKVGMEIRIPVAEVEVEEELVEPAEPDSLEVHVVQKGETVYGIAKQYGVSQKELLLANGNLMIGLKEGMRIRIPGRVIPKEEVPVDTVKKDTVAVHVPDSVDRVNVGLMLPFGATFPDSGDVDFAINVPARVALSYYRGFRFAVDSMSSLMGVGMHVHVFDVTQDSLALERVFRTEAFQNLDVVIGPFYNEAFELTADRCAETGVPVICPVPKPSKLLFKRPNTIKTVPSTSMQIDALAKLCSETLKDSNLVLINSNKMTDQENIDFFKSRYAKALGLPDTFADDAMREAKLWDINSETLQMRFADSGDYTLIVPSTHAVFVAELLRGLYDLQFDYEGMYRFRVIGLEDWQKYAEDIDIKYLHTLNVTLPLPQYVNLDYYKVHNYHRQFHRHFGYQPDQFATQGFDLAAYLMQMLQEHPKEWFKSPEEFRFQGISEVYDFTRIIPSSGIENQFIRFYEYDSYRLKEFVRWPAQKKK